MLSPGDGFDIAEIYNQGEEKLAMAMTEEVHVVESTADLEEMIRLRFQGHAESEFLAGLNAGRPSFTRCA